TGRPKGVCIPHKAISRLVKEQNYVEINGKSKIAQLSNFSFDAATFEIWGSLLNESEICIIDKHILLTPWEFEQKIKDEHISIAFLTTALFNQYSREIPKAFKNMSSLLFGGEKSDPKSVATILNENSQLNLIHVYGPTENTTFSTYYKVDSIPAGSNSVPIGKPISNTRTYILDQKLAPVPIGVVGELYLGGDGLATEYLNQEEITNQSFINAKFENDFTERLYKTGDLVKYLDDGNIEFIGRKDNQIKLRGFRIETKEIERIIECHAEVKQAIVIPYEGETGNKELIAYIIPEKLDENTDEAKSIEEWESIFNGIYEEKNKNNIINSKFNTAGWVSSYTNQPIPDNQMKEWLENTLRRIKDLNPRSVLEIGCGTGMLLLNIAPTTDRYMGVDISNEALEYVKSQMDKNRDQYNNVILRNTKAHEISKNIEGEFDTIILNSVIQYFPDFNYLINVIRNSIKKLKDGGKIFIGDVRNLKLLKVFHTSVIMHKDNSNLGIEILKNLIEERVSDDNELVLSPAFFEKLREFIPEIEQVEILSKIEETDNELTKYRYDVILHKIDRKDFIKTVPPLTFGGSKENLPKIIECFKEQSPSILIKNIKDSRLNNDMEKYRNIYGDPNNIYESESLELKEIKGLMINSYAQNYNNKIYLSTKKGCIDILFVRQDLIHKKIFLQQDQIINLPFEKLSNNPGHATQNRGFMLSLNQYIKNNLPEYMIPSHIIQIKDIPLTPNGKIDIELLPTPYTKKTEQFELPRTDAEEIIAQIWKEILGIKKISRNDNFFEIGGHSLLATQFISRIKSILDIRIPLYKMFELKNLKEIALEIENSLALELDKMSEEEVAHLIN
ncbi:AMP-binding protein, partial [Bacillus cereus]|uniref:AMP-binding protein n=1 Tax=Bacillus cereus TaxID=1396 RepID=UPI000C0236D3